MSDTRKARCLCGAVTFEATLKDAVGACHCTTCRRWGGGPLMAMDCGASVSGADETAIATYASSDWAERAFCKSCGAHLWYRLLPGGGFAPEGQYLVSAGLFEDQDGLVFDHEVYVDGNPGWYDFAGGETRKRLTEHDIQQMIGAADGGETHA